MESFLRIGEGFEKSYGSLHGSKGAQKLPKSSLRN